MKFIVFLWGFVKYCIDVAFTLSVFYGCIYLIDMYGAPYLWLALVVPAIILLKFCI